MSTKQPLQLLCALALLCGSVFGQVVSSDLLGTITDPSGASIAGAEVQIKDQARGLVRSVTSGVEGIFRFTNLTSGAYTLTIKASGFKTYTQQAINLSSSEIRDLGLIKLTLGELRQEVSVTAAATPVQTASTEKSALVDGEQLLQIALKGRDLMGMLKLMPGVMSTSPGETTTEASIAGVSINGAGNDRHNFTVDGITDLDTGSNASLHYEPNMDSIAEIKVLTAGRQAEYGRMASGTISVITKSGTRQFHGSAWSTWRHEQFNAKGFFENLNNQPKSIYRYFIGGLSLGGPLYIPKVFNTDKRRVFFFFSQEYTRQRPGTTVTYGNVPTALERAGDFSQSFDANGKLIAITDPLTGKPFPGNKIPAERMSANGLAMLNFFPLPNRCGAGGAGSDCWQEADPTQLYRRNYRGMYTGNHPRRNDVVRLDFNLTSKLTSWVRYINDYDLNNIGSGLQLLNSQNRWAPYSIDSPNPGHGYAIGITYTITPRMVNEFTFGKSYNTYDIYAHDQSQVDRARMGNPPHWFDENDPNFKNDVNRPRPGLSPGSQFYQLAVPSVIFGGGATVGQMSYTDMNAYLPIPFTNFNDAYTFIDNFSAVKGKHSIKAGLYYERTGKVQAGGVYLLGYYNFASTSANPNDSGNGYANAYLGNFQSYLEGGKVIGDFWFTNIEAYVQDSWRVSRRLTVEAGVRFYHLPPQENLNGTSAGWIRSTYDSATAARLYYPAYDAQGKQVAKDLATGYTTYPALVGTFVPYSVGSYAKPLDYAPGMQIADGKNSNIPLSMFSQPRVAPALRFGLAWDVFGNGKTAIRTSFGQYFNRGSGNEIMGMNGIPPVILYKTAYYSNLGAVPQLAGNAAVSPIAFTSIGGDQKYEGLVTATFGIQQNVGFGTVLDVSYVGSFRRHILQSRQANAIPMYSRYDPANLSPWLANLPPRATRSLPDNLFRPLAGLGGFSLGSFDGSANYNSMQVSVRRAMSHGLSYGLAYTWSKTMATSPSPYWPDNFRNYGPTGTAPQVAAINYIYEVPGLGKRLNLKWLGWVTDHWTLSGITELQGHTRSAISCCSWTQTTTANPAPEMTGSAEGARINILGNPVLPRDQVTFFRAINTDVFAPPTPCSWTNKTMDCFGNAGAASWLSIPTRVNNWDMSLSKRFPLKSENRTLIFRAEMYNIFNHTQFSGVNLSATFNVSTLQQTNTQFGRFNAAMPSRRMAMTLRFQF
jgi:hypothetical protein